MTATVERTDTGQAVTQWLTEFDRALTSEDATAASGLFTEDGFWRDLIAFTPNIKTFEWFHGGNLHQSRHYSAFLALQLKARLEGIPTPVYGLQEVHHRR